LPGGSGKRECSYKHSSGTVYKDSYIGALGPYGLEPKCKSIDTAYIVPFVLWAVRRLMSVACYVYDIEKLQRINVYEE
jgi:hypothetical protein